MWTQIIYYLHFIALIINAQSTEAIVEQSPSTCSHGADCNASQSTNDSVSTTEETVPEFSGVDNNFSLRSTTAPSQNSPPLNFGASSTTKSTVTESLSRDGICDCDLTISSCDVNCCCDIDCNDLDVNTLFSCNKYLQPKLYDDRYCYDSNYIQYNQSRYLLEKIRDNLLCIVEDNSPPVYTSDYDPIIFNLSVFEDIVNNNKKSRYKWDQRATHIPKQFISHEPYRYGDVIWKIQNGYVKKLEIPQTGFTSICSFKKSLNYLEDWKHSCIQVSLENTNLQLFSKTFTNFTVVASPVLYNDSNFGFDNQSCPKNVCILIKSHYCSDSWSLCKNETTSVERCANGTCYNVVRGVRFVITHSGLKGIDEVNVYLKIGNVSEKFYQNFEVKYKWLKDDWAKMFHLSGSRGYILGKPIIIGNLISNKTNGKDFSYVNINKDEYFLSLPVSKSDGRCSEDYRYEVNFGEDLKLNCKIESRTKNFSANSCVDLQNRIVRALLKNIQLNETDVDKLTTYVAKWNQLDVKDGTNNWVKILFDRIPQNVVTAQVIDDQLLCSGLVTSLRIDVVHRQLPDPQTTDNYKILGVAVTFSEDSDIYWNKCEGKNCAELLSVDVTSYVIFHDVSKPSKYFYAEGPNLDISLPHDFFYPFVNNSHSLHRMKYNLLSICTCFALVFIINVSS